MFFVSLYVFCRRNRLPRNRSVLRVIYWQQRHHVRHRGRRCKPDWCARTRCAQALLLDRVLLHTCGFCSSSGSAEQYMFVLRAQKDSLWIRAEWTLVFTNEVCTTSANCYGYLKPFLASTICVFDISTSTFIRLSLKLDPLACVYLIYYLHALVFNEQVFPIIESLEL